MASLTSLSQKTREKVNDQLSRIKKELNNESILSESDVSDTEDELSQPLPQQFYQDMDYELQGKPRDEYVSSLIKVCSNEFYKIAAYRERLADRAKSLVGCPQTRLIRRRTSPSSSKEKKCATDCYVLHAFIQGDRSREIQDVFSNSSLNPFTIEDDDIQTDTDEFKKPDTYTMISKILSTVNEVARQQASDSFAIQNIQSEISSITIQFNRFQGSLNRIISALPREGISTGANIEKLQSDVTKLETAITTMNQRLVERDYSKYVQNNDNNNNNNNNNNNTPITNTEVTTTQKSYAEAANPPPNIVVASTSMAQLNSESTTNRFIAAKQQRVNDKTIQITQDVTPKHLKVPDKSTFDNKSTQNNKQTCYVHIETTNNGNTESTNKTKNKEQTKNIDQNKTSNVDKNVESNKKQGKHGDDKQSSGKFIAVRRRQTNTVSYFIGNIDPSVSESDVVEHVKNGGIRVKSITMFYGRKGSSARMNFFPEDVPQVESDAFWPKGVTVRKWVSRSEWEQNRPRRRHYPRDRYGHNWYRRDADDDEYDNERDRVDREVRSYGDDEMGYNKSSNDNFKSSSDRTSVWDPDYMYD